MNRRTRHGQRAHKDRSSNRQVPVKQLPGVANSSKIRKDGHRREDTFAYRQPAVESWLAPGSGLHAIDRWSTLVPNFKPTVNRGPNEAEQDSGVAGRNCRRSSVDCMGLLCWDATGSALRGHAEARIIPEGTALSVFHAHLDCADIRDVDSHRASLRVGSRHCRPWTEDGPQNWDDRRILRGRAGQLWAS